MESKRRGLSSKSKLVTFLYNRGTKPSSTALHPLASVEPADDIQKINKPKDSSFVIVNQGQVYPQQKPPKLAFVVPDRAGRLENFQGLGAEDEAVDTMAARYISNVQERFRLECVKLEEMQLI